MTKPSEQPSLANERRANRFSLRCPHCDKEGTNSRDAGGNEKCFHCGECGFVECEWCSPVHEVFHPDADERRKGWEEAIEAARKAICQWCYEGKPVAEPLYGRADEVWHVPFPDVPEDTQRVRCQAEAIVRLIFPGAKEE